MKRGSKVWLEQVIKDLAPRWLWVGWEKDRSGASTRETTNSIKYSRRASGIGDGIRRCLSVRGDTDAR
jgi:hypothetical protein